MNTSIISHRMFVAALSHDEGAAKNVRAAGKGDSKSRKDSRERPVKELTPHQLMLSLMKDGFEPWQI